VVVGGVLGVVTGGITGPVEAITGEMGEPTGGLDVMPLKGTVSLGYVAHVKVNGGAVSLPDANRVKLICWPWEIVMVPPDAVNGPIVAGAEGTARAKPDEGTGVGMGTSKLMAPEGIAAGVAPLASTWVVADPAMLMFPRAWAAATMSCGMLRLVW
jgi:hypothetical protein